MCQWSLAPFSREFRARRPCRRVGGRSTLPIQCDLPSTTLARHFTPLHAPHLVALHLARLALAARFIVSKARCLALEYGAPIDGTRVVVPLARVAHFPQAVVAAHLVARDRACLRTQAAACQHELSRGAHEYALLILAARVVARAIACIVQAREGRVASDLVRAHRASLGTPARARQRPRVVCTRQVRPSVRRAGNVALRAAGLLCIGHRVVTVRLLPRPRAPLGPLARHLLPPSRDAHEGMMDVRTVLPPLRAAVPSGFGRAAGGGTRRQSEDKKREITVHSNGHRVEYLRAPVAHEEKVPSSRKKEAWPAEDTVRACGPLASPPSSVP
jgi:hypothetical protein